MLDDGRKVTVELFRQIVAEELAKLRAALGDAAFAAGNFEHAAKLIDGITTARKIREQYRDTRIIVISGGGKTAPDPYEPDAISTRSYLASASKAGADRALTKPFDRQEILRVVRDLLEED